MRHGVKSNHLGRTTSHRKAMLSNMASSLMKHKKITTTLAKAKALRIFVEPLITKAKSDSVHNRRIVFSYLRDKEAIKELFGPISEKIMDRPGGYTRILKLGNRMGDNADMAFIELVDFNEFMPAKSPKAKKKSTRRGRAKSAKSTDETVDAIVEDIAENADDTTTSEEVKD
jgi:large subunit ribosomal protein L17